MQVEHPRRPRAAHGAARVQQPVEHRDRDQGPRHEPRGAHDVPIDVPARHGQLPLLTVVGVVVGGTVVGGTVGFGAVVGGVVGFGAVAGGAVGFGAVAGGAVVATGTAVVGDPEPAGGVGFAAATRVVVVVAGAALVVEARRASALAAVVVAVVDDRVGPELLERFARFAGTVDAPVRAADAGFGRGLAGCAPAAMPPARTTIAPPEAAAQARRARRAGCFAGCRRAARSRSSSRRASMSSVTASPRSARCETRPHLGRCPPACGSVDPVIDGRRRRVERDPMGVRHRHG